MRIIPITVLVATLAAPVAFAETDTAQAAFEEGAALFENAEYSQAAVSFRKAYKL